MGSVRPSCKSMANDQCMALYTRLIHNNVMGVRFILSKPNGIIWKAVATLKGKGLRST